MEGDPFQGRDEITLTAFLFHKCYLMGYMLPENDIYKRGVFKVGKDEESYLAHLDEIRRLTPPDRLLEFDVKRHGWTELSNFVGTPVPAGAGPRLPHTRSKES